MWRRRRLGLGRGFWNSVNLWGEGAAPRVRVAFDGSALALADALGLNLALGRSGVSSGLKARMPVNVERASATAP
jgi:hypothetical protein